MIGRARESRNPKKVIRVTLMESYGEIGRVPVNLSSVQREDIVVFCINQSVYIKRIVAVAGDTVQLTDCRVYVNGVYVYPYTCDIDSQIEYHLEEGQYFVLGDNGEASIDSRVFGVISENQLLGKAIAF